MLVAYRDDIVVVGRLGALTAAQAAAEHVLPPAGLQLNAAKSSYYLPPGAPATGLKGVPQQLQTIMRCKVWQPPLIPQPDCMQGSYLAPSSPHCAALLETRRLCLAEVELLLHHGLMLQAAWGVVRSRLSIHRVWPVRTAGIPNGDAAAIHNKAAAFIHRVFLQQQLAPASALCIGHPLQHGGLGIPFLFDVAAGANYFFISTPDFHCSDSNSRPNLNHEGSRFEGRAERAASRNIFHMTARFARRRMV